MISTKRRVLIGLLVGLALWLAAMPVVADGRGTKTILGQDFVLEPGDRLEDDLVIVRGHVRLRRGSVAEGDVLVMGGDLAVEGCVEGDVVVLGGSAQLASSAVIEGDLVVFGAVRKRPGAAVRGNTIEGLEATVRTGSLPGLFFDWPGFLMKSPFPLRPYLRVWPGTGTVSSLMGMVRSVAGVLIMLLVVAAIAAALPSNLHRLIDVMGINWLLSLVMGLLTILLAVILIPILAITCIGIPVAIVLLIALLLCIAMGWIAAAAAVGNRLRAWFNLRGLSPLLEALLGALCITLLARVPGAGPVSAVLLASWGVGAVVVTRFGHVPYPPPAVPEGTQPSATGGAQVSRAADTGTPASEPDLGTRRLDQPHLPPDS